MSVPASRNDLKDWCLDNKYTKWYCNIIDNALSRGWTKKTPFYKEKHHIIPKSILQNNFTVYLTAREHFICHLLLPKMLKDAIHIRKMIIALHRIIHGNKYDVYYKSSRIYAIIKKWHSKVASERSKSYWNNLSENDRKIFLEYRKTKQKPAIMSLEQRKMQSEKMKERLSCKENHPLYKKGHSEESKKKMSLSKKGQGLGKKWFNNGIIELLDYKENVSPEYIAGKITKLPVLRTAAGKKWYHNPKTKEEKYFFINEQEKDFIIGRLKNV